MNLRFYSIALLYILIASIVFPKINKETPKVQ